MFEKLPEQNHIDEQKLALASLINITKEKQERAEEAGMSMEEIETIKFLYEDARMNKLNPAELAQELDEYFSDESQKGSLLFEGEETPMIIEVSREYTVHRSLTGKRFGQVPTSLFRNFVQNWAEAQAENHFKD